MGSSCTFSSESTSLSCNYLTHKRDWKEINCHLWQTWILASSEMLILNWIIYHTIAWIGCGYLLFVIIVHGEQERGRLSAELRGWPSSLQRSAAQVLCPAWQECFDTPSTYVHRLPRAVISSILWSKYEHRHSIFLELHCNPSRKKEQNRTKNRTNVFRGHLPFIAEQVNGGGVSLPRSQPNDSFQTHSARNTGHTVSITWLLNYTARSDHSYVDALE